MSFKEKTKGQQLKSVFCKRAFHLIVPFSLVPCACHLSLLLPFLWTKGTSRKACLSTAGDSKTCFSQSADSVKCGALGKEKGWHLVRYQRDTRKALYERHCCEILIKAGWLRNRTGTAGTVFPETESGTGTAGTVFPKPKPEPSFPVKLY